MGEIASNNASDLTQAVIRTPPYPGPVPPSFFWLPGGLMARRKKQALLFEKDDGILRVCPPPLGSFISIRRQ